MKKIIIVVSIVMLAILVGASANAMTEEQMAAEILGESMSKKHYSPKKSVAMSSDLTTMRRQLLKDLEKSNQKLIDQERAATSSALDEKLQVFSGIKGSIESHDRKMTGEFNRTNNTVWENSKWVGEKVDYRFSLLATITIIGFAVVIIMIIVFARKAKTIIGFRTPNP